MAEARILIVEDERIVAKSIEKHLTKLGYRVVGMAATAKEAVRMAEETRPDLILMDIHLQGQPDGISAAATIREQLHISVIYLTANADDHTLQRARITEPLGYLIKPFETRELHATIEMALYRTQMEERLRASEERFRALSEASPIGIFLNEANGGCTYTNQRWQEIFGLSLEESLGDGWSRAIHPEDRASVFAQWTADVQAGREFSREFRILTPQGKLRWVHARAKALYNQQGVLLGHVGTDEDITPRKALEGQRADFLAMLTHDIKNPLNVVMGYTEFLLANAKERGAREDEDMLQRLQSNAMTILSLVANYLDVVKVEGERVQFNKQPFPLNELLEKVINRHAGEAQKRRISIALHLPDESPIVEGDIPALERVFFNLLHNALKFTPELGHIKIRLEQQDREAIVSISDSGPGITPVELTTIFHKYTQGTHRREGAGLGLFIVKTFVEAHGGRVEAENVLGEGACFRVYLPLTTEEE
jgi:PAS domain S-box-containing protein